MEFTLIGRIAYSSFQKSSLRCWNHKAVQLYALHINHFKYILAFKEKKKTNNTKIELEPSVCISTLEQGTSFLDIFILY